MACKNCRKPKAPRPPKKKDNPHPTPDPVVYSLELPNGKVQQYGSRLERDAARVRSGLYI